MSNTTPIYRDIAIFDDISPSDFSPFRNIEYEHYLNFFNAQLFSLEGWHLWISNDEFSAQKDKLPFAVNTKSRISRLDDSQYIVSNLAYVTFLGNAHRLMDYFELRQMPFILQLYPGGGFEIDSAEVDDRLRRVLLSPLCRKVIVTQKLTRTYITRKIGCPDEKIVDIYGGVFNTNIDFEFHRDKKFYPSQKDTIDICFVAHKYGNDLASKGYDKFVAIAKTLTLEFKQVRFHVIGDYSENDIDIAEYKDWFTFYGKKASAFFAEFYPKMDMIISINRPFTLAPGAFDGFPTGACMEAGFRGVLNCINDPLDLNVAFTDRENITLLDYDVDYSVQRISELIRSPSLLYDLSYKNWKIFRRVFDVDRQLWERTKVIVSELNKRDFLLINPLVSWSAMREFDRQRNQLSRKVASREYDNLLAEYKKIVSIYEALAQERADIISRFEAVLSESNERGRLLSSLEGAYEAVLSESNERGRLLSSLEDEYRFLRSERNGRQISASDSSARPVLFEEGNGKPPEDLSCSESEENKIESSLMFSDQNQAGLQKVGVLNPLKGDKQRHPLTRLTRLFGRRR